MREATFSVDSSLGHMDVDFGWDGWVSITTPRSTGASYAARRLAPTEEDLADVLSSFGLPDGEADSLASELWRRRPDLDEAVEEEVLADASDASGRRLLIAACIATLVLLLAAAGLVAVF